MILWAGLSVKYLPELAFRQRSWGVRRMDMERVGERHRGCNRQWHVDVCGVRAAPKVRWGQWAEQWGKPLEEVKSPPWPGPRDLENGDVSDLSVLSSETTHMSESPDHSVQSPGRWPRGRWAAGVSRHTDCFLNMPSSPAGRWGVMTSSPKPRTIHWQKTVSTTWASPWLSL